MPQGVTNAPSAFQRLTEKCMGDVNLKEVFTSTFEEPEKRLVQVLERLKEFELKLSQEKCKFFQSSVCYLGHVVSEKGVETDPEKLSSLKSWPVPRNLKELRSFLGFAGYYRGFIRDYATLVKPLNSLTRGYAPMPVRPAWEPSSIKTKRISCGSSPMQAEACRRSQNLLSLEDPTLAARINLLSLLIRLWRATVKIMLIP
uniref:ribonuclease H n=1 Tax=Knipowitschia caucasica TaxID=637954 RepID=A0AAV2IZH5_KNICA